MTANPLQALRVVPAQVDCRWHDPEANRQRLASLFATITTQADLIILPEMFTSGFTQFPETIDSQTPTLQWMQEQAVIHNTAISGSVAVEIQPATVDNKAIYTNRLLFVEPNGQYHSYDKIHLFSMAGEQFRYQAGNERKVIEYRGWRILLTVCYDLRFPVFCRNQNDYDLMLCVANWPQSRRLHWRSLLQARAIENQAYVVGVNRVGTDGNGLEYSGDSMVVSMNGQHLFDTQSGEEVLPVVTIEKKALDDYRDQFPAWKDADAFTLSL